MRPDLFQPVDLDDLTYGEHLIVWAFRTLAKGRTCAIVRKAFEHGCGDQANAAFTAMQVFVQQLSVVGRRPIDHAPPGCPTVMRDELVLLRLFAAAQDRDPARFAAHFRWLAASPPDPTAQRAATFVAAALIAHGQRLSSPDAVEPAPERSTVKPRAPIHDALRVASRPWAQDARDRDIALNE